MSESKPAAVRERRALNQPWRAWIALAEAVVAVAAILIAVPCWQRGIVPIVSPVGGGRPPLVSTVFYGNWMSGAIGLCTVAGLLVVDALRQLILALRTRTSPEVPMEAIEDDEPPAEPATA